jgi:hypothetical protein
MRVSILVPVYNKSQNELTRCFESILDQTCKDFELIITDDGSKPETAAFLDEYTESNKTRCAGGIHCFHYLNGGVWEARNKGQEKASGEWIMHVNADDLVSAMTIETALKAADEHENVDMVYWRLRDVDWPPYLDLDCGGDRIYTNTTEEKFHIRQDILCATPFCDVTCMVRHEKSQPFNPELTGAEFERQVRVVAGCRAVYFVDKSFYNYVSSKYTISSCQADIKWRVAALKDFREALIVHGFKTTDEYLIALTVAIIHFTARSNRSIYKEINKSVVGEILRSRPIKEFGSLTRKMRIICTLFKAKQFFLLDAMLRFARALKNRDSSHVTEIVDKSNPEGGFFMNSFHPLVSIVIPVYNGSDYLCEAIDSALKQTYDNIEVIVVNDGSTDDTNQIAMSYGHRIRYFVKENGGTSTALNMGISNMRGEYFSWLSHDDLYYPRKIEREVEELSKLSNKNTVMRCDWDVIDVNNKQIYVNVGEYFLNEYPPRRKSQMFPIIYLKIHGCAMLVPKACFDVVGVFDVDLRVAHDYELFYRLLKNFPNKLISEVLVTARDGLNRQGKRAYTRCNVEYSLLLIDIIDHLKEEEILEMAPDKAYFYLYWRDLYRVAGFTIAGEYMHSIAESLGYVGETAASTPEPPPPHYSIFKKLYRYFKGYSLRGTKRKILAKLYSLVYQTKLWMFLRALKKLGIIGTMKKILVRLSR